MAPPTPSAGVLASLDDDVWARLVGHARRVVRELPDDERASLGPLPGRSNVELLGGEGRDELTHALTDGGALWDGVWLRLADEDEDGWLAALSEPDAAEHTDDADGPADDDGQAEQLAGLRQRVRDVTAQRDAARRQVTGAEARAAAAERKLADAHRELDEVRARVTSLAEELAAAGEVREAALDRVRRQHETELAGLREEVRALRRAEEERHLAERRREEAEEAAVRAAEQAQQQARRAAKTGRQGATPGRPSRLPPGMQPGTSEAARALLTPKHRVLVDGYNVTMRHRGHLDLEQQRAALVAILEAAAARYRCDIAVLFDSRHGTPPGGQRSRSVGVRFTAPSVTADDEIVFEVSAASEDQPILVVTDDRELRDRVRPFAVDVLSTGEFLRAVE